jgi:hypothetical protein
LELPEDALPRQENISAHIAEALDVVLHYESDGFARPRRKQSSLSK